MIDLERETILSLSQARRHPAMRTRSGKAPHPSKMYRLIAGGIKAADGERVALEALKLPAGWVTTAEAIQRFIDRLTFGPEGPQAGRSIAAATSALEQAEKLLDTDGIAA